MMSSDGDFHVLVQPPGEGDHVQGVEEHVHGAEEPVQEEGVVAGDLHQGEVAVNTDENSNEVVSADNLFRVCASSVDDDHRKILKTSKNLPAAFSFDDVFDFFLIRNHLIRPQGSSV